MNPPSKLQNSQIRYWLRHYAPDGLPLSIGNPARAACPNGILDMDRARLPYWRGIVKYLERGGRVAWEWLREEC
jgi:hypothetical protein